jgi:hypothetical protein
MHTSCLETIRRVTLQALRRLVDLITAWRAPDSEAGMTTAELLGNAALGIAALVAIWAVMQTLGLDVVDWMRGQLRVRPRSSTSWRPRSRCSCS